MAGDRWRQVGASWQTKAEGESLCISSGCISTWMLSVWEEFLYWHAAAANMHLESLTKHVLTSIIHDTLTRVHYSNRRQWAMAVFSERLNSTTPSSKSHPYPFPFSESPLLVVTETAGMPLIAPTMHQHKLVFTHMAYPLPAPLLPLLFVPCFISTFLYFVLISSAPAPSPCSCSRPAGPTCQLVSFSQSVFSQHNCWCKCLQLPPIWLHSGRWALRSANGYQ